MTDAFINRQRKFYFGNSISNVDVSEFLGFIDIINGLDEEFVRENMNFDDVDWNQLVENFIQKQSHNDKQERRPVTEFNKPLL